MKKYLLLLLSGLFIANFAVSAQAADHDKDKMMMGSSKMMGMHKMAGTVDKIDHAKGTLMLKSGVADMTLHFPPPAIKDLKNGDTITVELGFAKEGAMK